MDSLSDDGVSTKFVNCNKCTLWTGDVDHGELCVGRDGGFVGNLYLLSCSKIKSIHKK